MSDEIKILFVGPFSWPGPADAPCVFDVEMGREAGIYLWTVPLTQGHLIYYVGETRRSFSTRLREHYTEHASAMYHVYSPAEFACGEKLLLWPGRFDATNRKSVRECVENYTNLYQQIREMTFILRFFLAPLSCAERIQRRVEAAIAQALYAAPGIVGTFQDQGIRYCSRINDEEAIPCVASSPVPLLGLPERFWA
jgi:hypothetical protein